MLSYNIGAFLPFNKNKMYNTCQIYGFTIHFEIYLNNKDKNKNGVKTIFDKYPKLYETLSYDLNKICSITPKTVLETVFLANVEIYLNNETYFGHIDSKINIDGNKIYNYANGIAFHHDIRWLKINNINLNKCCKIEIYNCYDYLTWRICQPCILFHEFCHFYHYYIGKERSDIINVYNNVVIKQNKYNIVKHVVAIENIKQEEQEEQQDEQNEQDKHDEKDEKDEKDEEQSCDNDNTQKRKILVDRRGYASLNYYEYFAEISEAYFGNECNFYPFNRQQLKRYDITGYKLLQKLWYLNEKQLKKQHQLAMNYV